MMLKIAVSTGTGAGLLALRRLPAAAPAEPPQPSTTTRPRACPAGQSASDSRPLIVLGGNKNNNGSATGIQVNAYLWRATLDTLSFMPLVSADPFGGVIITDWYSPPATPDERFKANAYILSQQMTANAIQVSLFHQILQNGQWVDAPVDPNTVSGLEDRILSRAADLRAAAENHHGLKKGSTSFSEEKEAKRLFLCWAWALWPHWTFQAPNGAWHPSEVLWPRFFKSGCHLIPRSHRHNHNVVGVHLLQALE